MVEDEAVILFLRRVANAVIMRALMDLKGDKNTYRYRTARNFCLGVNDYWKESLLTWCEVGDIEPKKVVEKAREYIRKNVN